MKVGFILTNGLMGGFQTQFINLANLFSKSYTVYFAIYLQDKIDPIILNSINKNINYVDVNILVDKSDIIQTDGLLSKNIKRKLCKNKWHQTVDWYCTTKTIPFFERILKRYTPPNIISCTNFVSKTLRINNSHKIAVGVDIDLYRPMSDIEKKYDIMIIGRMRDVKNHRLFIEIAKKGNFSFLMIGGTATWSTGHVNEIEKYVRENARDGIDLVTGVVENNKVPFYINQAKIALVVSKMEAQGLNSLEPMSCGVPAIGRNVGGVSESIQDFPELLIPFDAPAEVYIEKIKKYLNKIIRQILLQKE